MEKKSTVSDAAKAAAAKQAAAAKKAAEAKKDATKAAPAKQSAPKAPKKQPAPKAPEEVEEVAAEVAEEEPARGGNGGNVKGLRIGAIILWILAVACEVGAFFALSYAVRNGAQWPDMEILLFIGALVLDALFCIVAAQLWKKANRIQPSLASSKLVRTLWHQLGVIMVLVCFLPIGIFLLAKSDKLNKKTKTILIALLAVLLVGAGAASTDFKQPSEEEVAQLQQAAIAESAGTVYWTRFGKSYHFDLNCPYIAGKTLESEGGTLNQGTLQDAFDANRWDPCDTCAGGAEAKLGEAAEEAEQPAG